MDSDLRAELAAAEDAHWWFEARRRIVASVLDRAGVSGPVLEVGCGNGANLAMLSAFGPVTGVEPDPADRGRALERGIGVVRTGRLPDGLELGDARFAAVLALDVIEHVEQDLTSVSRLAGLLAPGGLLVLTVPANPWMWSRHDERNGHVRRYTRSGLRKLLTEAGLVPHRVTAFNTVLFPIVALVRGLGGLFGRGDAGTTVPPAPVNALLAQLMGVEGRLLAHLDLPVGVSLLALYTRPAG